MAGEAAAGRPMAEALREEAAALLFRARKEPDRVLQRAAARGAAGAGGAGRRGGHAPKSDRRGRGGGGGLRRCTANGQCIVYTQCNANRQCIVYTHCNANGRCIVYVYKQCNANGRQYTAKRRDHMRRQVGRDDAAVRVMEDKAARVAHDFARGLAGAELDGVVTDEALLLDYPDLYREKQHGPPPRAAPREAARSARVTP